MKRTFWKSAMTVLAVSLGAMVAPPAFAACDLCSLAKDGEWEEILNLLHKRPEVYDGADAQSIAINGQRNNGQTALFVATRYNHLNIVAGLLNDTVEPADPNIANKHGRTPIMWAAQNGNLDIAFELIERGNAEINTIGGQQNKSALQYAADGEHWEMAKYLLSEGANPPFAPETLAFAVEHDIPQLIQAIFANGGAEFPYGVHPSLLFAGAATGDLLLVQVIHADGGNCEIQNASGETPVDAAHQNGHAEMRDWLIAQNCGTPQCQINEEWTGDSCVCDAENGYEEFNDFCVPMCAEGLTRDLVTGECFNSLVRDCTDEGKHWMPQSERCVPIPPIALSYSRNASFIEEYAESGGDIHAKGDYDRDLMLASAIYAAIDSDNKISLLLNNGVSSLSKDSHDYTPLHSIVRGWTTADKAVKKEAALRLLLDNGAQSAIDATNDWDSTPLYMAAYQSGASIAQQNSYERWKAYGILLDYGANPNYFNSDNWTPFGVAIYDGIPLNMVHKTISSGLNLNEHVSPHSTALRYAVFANRRDIIAALTNAGANCNAQGPTGGTPWGLARYNNDDSMLAVLRENCPYPETQRSVAECETSEATAVLNADGTITEVPAQVDKECLNSADHGEVGIPEPVAPPE